MVGFLAKKFFPRISASQLVFLTFSTSDYRGSRDIEIGYFKIYPWEVDISNSSLSFGCFYFKQFGVFCWNWNFVLVIFRQKISVLPWFLLYFKFLLKNNLFWELFSSCPLGWAFFHFNFSLPSETAVERFSNHLLILSFILL